MQNPVEAVFDELLAYLAEHSPTAATSIGDHRRDGDLDDWGPGSCDTRLRALGRLQAALTALDGLDADAHGDRIMLSDALAAHRFDLEGKRSWQRDPLFYLDLATGGVYDLIRRDDLEARPRQEAAASRAAQVPRLLDQARRNLAGTPVPHRDVALLRTPGAVSLFRDVLGSFAPQAREAADGAAAALETYAAWLESIDVDRAPDWRLGEERWNDALRLALGVRMRPEEVWERGQAALADLQKQAEDLAHRVLGRTDLSGPELVRAALDETASDHASRTALVDDARQTLTEITAFLRDGDLFDLPEPDTLRVEEVPPFQQGIAVAFFVPAPPLEPNAPHTYYLSPVPADWDDDKAESFLREYNAHALRSVGIHEAYPGHYVHFAYAQRHPRLLRRTLWNSACVEGWAVYAEREVVAAGFGDERLRLVSVKMDMRAVANALLDQGLHVHGWDDEQAMRLMTHDTYQERSEAEGKLVRGQVTAGQLSTYFVGGEEMADLRSDVEALLGESFDARRFHRELITQGLPPFPVLRQALGV